MELRLQCRAKIKKNESGQIVPRVRKVFYFQGKKRGGEEAEPQNLPNGTPSAIGKVMKKISVFQMFEKHGVLEGSLTEVLEFFRIPEVCSLLDLFVLYTRWLFYLSTFSTKMPFIIFCFEKLTSYLQLPVYYWQLFVSYAYETD